MHAAGRRRLREGDDGAAATSPEIFRYDAAHAFANETQPGLRRAVGQAGVGAHDGVPGQAPLTAGRRCRGRRLGLVIVGLGASLAPLDIAVNVALPAITGHFRLALGDVQWLVICYVLVYGSLMLVVRQAGRPVRPSPDLPHRPRDLRRRLRRLRRGARLAALPVGARGPGRRHGAGARPARRRLPPRCFPRASAPRRWRASPVRWRWPPPSARSWAACWSSCGAGPRSTGCGCRSRSSTLALSGLLPSPKPEPRPFDALGALLLAACMSTLLLSLVLSQRTRGAGPVGARPVRRSRWSLLAAYVRRANRVRRADHPAGAVRRSRASPSPTC